MGLRSIFWSALFMGNPYEATKMSWERSFFSWLRWLRVVGVVWFGVQIEFQQYVESATKTPGEWMRFKGSDTTKLLKIMGKKS